VSPQVSEGQPSDVEEHLGPVPCYVRSMMRAFFPCGQVPLRSCPPGHEGSRRCGVVSEACVVDAPNVPANDPCRAPPAELLAIPSCESGERDRDHGVPALRGVLVAQGSLRCGVPKTPHEFGKGCAGGRR